MVYPYKMQIFSKFPNVTVYYSVLLAFLPPRNSPPSCGEFRPPPSHMILGEIDIFLLGHRSWSRGWAHDPNWTSQNSSLGTFELELRRVFLTW